MIPLLSIHRLYGLTLASDFAFAHRLSAGDGPADLIFSCSHAPLSLDDDASRLYSSPWRDETGESIAHFDRYPEAEVFRFPGIADFHLEPGRITGHLPDPGRRDLMELRFLGPVLSYWLERMGIPALHASAIRIGDGAVGFISPSGGGKSSLAAAFVRDGSPLLTDDVLPVEESGGAFLARPGFPDLRMEPNGASHFLGQSDGLVRVSPDDDKLHVPVGPEGFGSFQSDALPLTCLYLLERRPDPGSSVEIQSLPRREAVIELVRHSFSPYLVEATGLQPARLDLFARLVRTVPVRRLVYPSGFEHLPRVAEALREAAGRAVLDSEPP